MTEEDIRLKNKIKLDMLRMNFLDGIRSTDFYKESYEGLLEYVKKYPEKYDKYYLYFDMDELNIFYNTKEVMEGCHSILLDYVVENPDGTFEIEHWEYD